MDTLLVTGSNGLLGATIIQQAKGAYRVVALSQHPSAGGAVGAGAFYQADIRDSSRIEDIVAQVRPRAIVHTAAMTSVDGCELQPEEAWGINVAGTENVARAAQGVPTRLIFLSTDYVFSGDRGPYVEGDDPQPLSVYGRTKLEAERLVAELCPDHCIARTSVLYGCVPGTRPNFVTWLLEELRGDKAVTAVTDQVSSPTLVDNLAKMVLAMVAGDAHGVYHAVGAEWLSRYDFALRVARLFELDPALVRPGQTPALKQPALRPRHSGLSVHRVPEELGVRPLGVDQGLQALRAQTEAAQP